MKTMKKWFKNNLFFRYVTTLFLVIFGVSLLLILEKSLPNQRVKSNILKSEPYYNDYFNQMYGDLDSLKDRHTMVDISADLFHLTMLYSDDNKHPYKEFIEMNKDSLIVKKLITDKHLKDMEIDSDYARYWHGHLIVLKPLLTFFTMNTIYIIYSIVLGITFLILLINIFKHSKILGFIFTLGSVSINLFMSSKCDNFFYVMMITLVSSIVIIKMYDNKSKNVDLVFLINGILTACFDMLSCGTLPVTVPLFIYVYLHIIDGKKFKFRLLFKYILLWLLGGVVAYSVKWILLVIHYNGGFREHVLEAMKLRTGSGDQGRLAMFIDTIYQVPHYIYPFDLYIFKAIFIGLGIASFINMLFDKKNRSNYISLFIICLIPFIRYFFLAEQSNYHNYYTYRAFLPVVMFLMLFISLSFVNIKEKSIN